MASSDVFDRAVKGAYAKLKDSIDKAILAFGQGQDANSKGQTLEEVVYNANLLLSMLDGPDQPAWVKVIRDAAQQAAMKDRDSLARCLRTILNNAHLIRPIDIEKHETLSFDALFDKLRQEFKLTELFDELVSELTAIIESGDVDNIHIMAALTKMAAILKANREGSYASMMGAFSSASFTWNIFFESLKEIPILRVPIVAFEKTREAGERKLRAAEDKFRDNCQQVLLEQIPKLRNLSQIADHAPRLSGEVSGKVIEQS